MALAKCGWFVQVNLTGGASGSGAGLQNPYDLILRNSAKIEFLLVGYDAQGNRMNYQDQSMEITLKPKQFENIMANGLHARMFLDLPAGRGFLRIAVQDLNAGRAGSLKFTDTRSGPFCAPACGDSNATPAIATAAATARNESIWLFMIF